MRLSRFLYVCIVVAALGPFSGAQRGHKEPTTVFTDENHLPAATYARPDPKLMLQQANDIKQLSEALPPDIENLNKGMISKDLAERLKKIEKLAKKLREEVQR
jgi:hypothetical protein